MIGASPGAYANLTHRGESWEMGDGARHYTGECLWSWSDDAEGSPQRVYPLYVSVRTVAGRESGVRIAPEIAEQRAVAEAMRRLIQARDPACRIEIVP